MNLRRVRNPVVCANNEHPRCHIFPRALSWDANTSKSLIDGAPEHVIPVGPLGVQFHKVDIQLEVFINPRERGCVADRLIGRKGGYVVVQGILHGHVMRNHVSVH